MEKEIEKLSKAINSAEKILEYLKEAYYERISFPNILTLVKANCEKITGFSWEKIKSPRSKRDLVIARWSVIYVFNKYSNNSISAIGKIVKRDHSTIIHALKKISTNYHPELQKLLSSWDDLIMHHEKRYRLVDKEIIYGKSGDSTCDQVKQSGSAQKKILQND